MEGCTALQQMPTHPHLPLPFHPSPTSTHHVICPLTSPHCCLRWPPCQVTRLQWRLAVESTVYTIAGECSYLRGHHGCSPTAYLVPFTLITAAGWGLLEAASPSLCSDDPALLCIAISSLQCYCGSSATPPPPATRRRRPDGLGPRPVKRQMAE